ncbi:MULTISPECIES: 2-keto-4-pentenoate hydratase [unclassified Ruegeria]|uniref:2-keto-4-pentenoate hydratase n=1 Tax=unclassified Ruegeria TaxID=2625375 RepID=UPI001491BB55|nr:MULTISPECIES: fumarylacetoacetate hydrolase family protein [unclassified Ruegeria]NOD91133.1 hydratase [Ruegeria sp. HKCCD4318]NOE16447.1 hydratase [Ruegeria sp. HKCCD4318-2]NOG07397.1 hydratase [Ruegeria sp. HKCCD4315]
MTRDIEANAQKIADALTSAQQISKLSSEAEQLTLDDAYSIASRVRKLQGKKRVGRKVGFTNRAIWPVYGVDQPIWGEVHSDGLFSTDQPVILARYSEPRIEPEIVLGLRHTPTAEMNDEQLAGCVEWVAPGFEIVQSIYPNWKFSVEDSIAAQGLHGCLVLGEKIEATHDILTGLAEVPLALFRGNEAIESGKGENALGGPIEVLAHLVSLLSEADQLQGGELVTTGTLTDAWPVSPGEEWSAGFGGVMNTQLSVRFT